MLRVWSTLEIPCPYPLFERIKLELAAMGGILTDTEYGAEILLHVIVPQSDAEALLARIVDVSNGRMAGHITAVRWALALAQGSLLWAVPCPVQQEAEGRLW